MSIEVHRPVDDSGSQIGDPGSAQTTVVVQSTQVLDDPLGWLGQDVVANGEQASLDGIRMRSSPVPGEDLIDSLLPTSLAKLESRRPQRLVDRSLLGVRRGSCSEPVEIADLGLGLSNRVVRCRLLVERRQGAVLVRRHPAHRSDAGRASS